MAEHAPLPLPEAPKLAENILHFARALRRAGVPVGSGRILETVEAVSLSGFTSRRDFYWVLKACLTSRVEHHETFDQVFRLFWRDPRYLEQMMSMLLPSVRGTQPDRRAEPAERRASEALTERREAAQPQRGDEVDMVFDASRTASSTERLRQLDFEQMSADEMQAARRILARLALPVPKLRTRRFEGRPGPDIDRRGTLRAMMRQGGELSRIATRRPRTRLPSLIVLCDISGSMSAYSRAVLQFTHGVVNRQGQGWSAVHAFTFGTRLTNITRHLARRDVDAALAAAGAEAQDWEGGTRIASCLTAFNRDWSRRVLGQGAVVLLVSDGLERGDPAQLGRAAERLSLSCRQLVWLNPLLRWEGFAPKPQGIRAILPHVDTLRAGHNIAALEGLAEALSQPDHGGEKARFMAALRH